MTYTEQEKTRGVAWKHNARALPEQAREPAQYVNKDGIATGPFRDFCLPTGYAAHNILEPHRAAALALFAELGIPWHAGVDGGPSNHLISSQVQCVNALMAMVCEPARIIAALGDLLGIHQVLQIEPGRFLTFEYIGPTDYFGESPTGVRVRGAHCTSVDAAFLHRGRDGVVELVLLEWKYTESYRLRTPDPARDAVRLGRYGAALADPASPVRDDVLAFEHLLDEPFSQLVRQQLLAHALEKAGAEGASRVRVLHVMPVGNDAYQQSLARPEHRALGGTVSAVWQLLLRPRDRFVSMDSARFLDPDITSREYVLRYADDVMHNEPELLDALEVEDRDGVENALYAEQEFDGEVEMDNDGIHLFLGQDNLGLSYPFTLSELAELITDLEAE